MLEKMTLQEAGDALGISPDAVRMRVKRGTMRGEKDAEGRWLVWVNTEAAEAEREPDASGEREPESGEQSAEALRARIGALDAPAIFCGSGGGLAGADRRVRAPAGGAERGKGLPQNPVKQPNLRPGHGGPGASAEGLA